MQYHNALILSHFNTRTSNSFERPVSEPVVQSDCRSFDDSNVEPICRPHGCTHGTDGCAHAAADIVSIVSAIATAHQSADSAAIETTDTSAYLIPHATDGAAEWSAHYPAFNTAFETANSAAL